MEGFQRRTLIREGWTTAKKCNSDIWKILAYSEPDKQSRPGGAARRRRDNSFIDCLLGKVGWRGSHFLTAPPKVFW